MAFIMKAVVIALKKFPNFNASFDQENERMIIKKFINLGMAVDTPDGLIVPNIKNADKKSILELAKELREVADQTIARTVQLAQLQNATFSITNFGAADVAYGTPIIPHPEVGILGVGKIQQKPVVINGEIKAAYVLPLSLAVDHRVIDGADAGRFLNTIKALLNDPMMLLLS
jgi:pyruvate dehydrogenase E2 component (dihydrolipoamide acetyltransferase)